MATKREKETPLQIYLREMGQEEMLSRDGEQRLGQIVAEGKISRYDHLIKEETFGIALQKLQERKETGKNSGLVSKIDEFVSSYQSNGKGISQESCQELRELYESHDKPIKTDNQACSCPY